MSQAEAAFRLRRHCHLVVILVLAQWDCGKPALRGSEWTFKGLGGQGAP